MDKKFVFFYFICLLSQSAFSQETTYHIKWNTKLPVEIKTVRGIESVRKRVTEKGIFTKAVSLPIKEVLNDGKVTLKSDEKAYLYALIKNVGKKTLRFSVAPHSTNPASSALGFKFNCLCNGHVYEVKPGEIWYKIMSLDNNKLSQAKDVVLDHHVFEVTGDMKLNAHNHQHHH